MLHGCHVLLCTTQGAVPTSDKPRAGIFVDLSHVNDGPRLLGIPEERKRTEGKQNERQTTKKETTMELKDEKTAPK